MQHAPHEGKSPQSVGTADVRSKEQEEIPKAQEPEQQQPQISALLLSSSLLFLNKNIRVGGFFGQS